MNKISAGLAAAVVLGAIGFTTYEARHARVAAQETAAAQNELEARANALTAAQQKLADVAQRNAALRQTREEAARAEAASKATRESPRSIANPLTKQQMVEAGREFLRGHPEARALLARHTRTEAIAGLMPFFKARGMTPEQIAMFQDAVEPSGEFTFGQSQLVAGYSMTLALSENPLSPEQKDERIRAVLGDEGFAAYRQFTNESARLTEARWTAINLASDLYWTPEPLSSAQAERLVQLLAESSPDFLAGKRVNPATLDWNALASRAQQILTPAQFRKFSENRQFEVNFRTLNQAERAAERAWLNARRQKE